MVILALARVPDHIRPQLLERLILWNRSGGQCLFITSIVISTDVMLPQKYFSFAADGKYSFPS